MGSASSDSLFFTPAGAGLTGANFSSSSLGDLDEDEAPDLVVTGVDTSLNPTATVYLNQGDREDQEDREAPLAVTSIRPESGAPGTQVRIYGTGFSPTAAENTVTFGGAEASIDSVSADMSALYARVPSGPSGPTEVSVTAGGETAEAAGRFSVVTGGETPSATVDAGLPDVGGPSDAADFDEDGDLDLAIVGTDSNGNLTAEIYRNDGSTFTPIDAGLTDATGGDVSWGDYNGDGRPDLVVVGLTDDGPSTTIYRNDGNGQFTAIGADLEGLTGRGVAEWGDYNSDGNLDLFIQGRDENDNPTAIVYENVGNDTFSPFEAGLTGRIFGPSADAGDYNNDGRIDIAINGGNGGGAEAAIYRNDGDGSFSEIDAGLTGTSAGDIGWGDYDGDGRLDLAIVGDDNGPSSDGEFAALYRNNGGGNFERAEAGIAGASGSAAWGDADGDGNLDLAVSGDSTDEANVNSSPEGRATTVYRNDGTGSLEPVAPLPRTVGGNTTWGDLNGNGTLELLVTGVDTSGVPQTVLFGSGGGEGLAVASIRPESGAPGAQLRIRGSGFSDNASENTVLFDSTTTATVDSATSTVLYVQVPGGLSGPVSVQVGTDGGTETAAHRFTVLNPERGGGPFDDLESNITQISGLEQADAAWADYDQDGDLDLAVTGRDGEGSPATLIYENDARSARLIDEYDAGEDPGSEDKFLPLGAGLTDLRNGAVSWGDVNGDGRPDLAVSGTDGSSPVTTVYLNEGGDEFTELEADLTGLRTGDLAWGDVNGDGRLDLLASGLDGPLEDASARTLVYVNQEDTTGGETVTLSALGAELTGLSFSDADWGDIDTDGDLDLVLTGQTGSPIDSDAAPSTIVYENQGDTDGDGKVDFQSLGTSVADLENGSVEWGDYDQDGDLDLLVTGEDGAGDPRSDIYENLGDTDGDGTPDFQSLDANLTGVKFGNGTWGDYDGDGDLDALVSGRRNNGVVFSAVYENTGAGSFEPTESDLEGIAGVETGTAVWADYDTDGDLDVFEIGKGFGGGPIAALYDNGRPAPPTEVTVGLTVEDSSILPDGLVVDWSYSNELALQRYNIYRSREPIPRSPGPSDAERTDTASTGRFGTYPDSDAEQGKTYYYRVTAVGRDGSESDFSEQTRFFWYRETVSTEAERTFGSRRDSSDYRLIAVPGRSPDPERSPRTLPQILPDTASWRAFRDDGSGPYEEYDQSEDFHLRPGRGFWVLSTSRWSGSGNTWETVQLQGDTVAVVDLHDGWNIISNPTDKNIAWSRVQSVNDLSAVGLYGFDGTYTREDTMASARSGKAYYMLNGPGRDKLLLPYPGSPAYPDTSQKQKADPKQKARREAPTLALRATQAEAGTSRVQIQFVDAAESGFDPSDVVAPTSPFSTLSLRLENPDSDPEPRQEYLATDRRPTLGEGQRFDLTLRSRREGPIQLSQEDLQGLSGAEIFLTVPGEDRSYDLRENRSVTLNAGRDTTRLRLAIGSSGYVDSQKETASPEEVRLRTYPNPMRQQGTLQYALPEEANVRIAVYDVLGRQVAQVVDRKQQAGRYTTTVDAGQLSSGIYFVRMSASGTTRTRKVTVVR